MGTPADQTGAKTAAAEAGWLPDCVYTEGKFESGLAFFADDLGRITRFSREPADLAAARRMPGQAALPGLVNGHSQAFQRALRGHPDRRGASRPDTVRQLAARLSAGEVYDTARMAFLEMLLGGITCVGEFHALVNPPAGAPEPGPDPLGREVIRAARSTGVRIALLRVACARGGFREPAAPGQAPFLTPEAEQFIRETEAVRQFAAEIRPGDEAWVGVGIDGLDTVPLDYLRAVAAYAHAQRLRLHVPLSARAGDAEGCLAEYGRTPAALLAQHGLLDKRFTAIHAAHAAEDEIRLLGAARAIVCACPAWARDLGEPAAPAAALLAAGAGVSLGTAGQAQTDLWEDARLLAPQFREAAGGRRALPIESAGALFHAATVAGARSLGGPGGALEVGRPADFFTVSLFDPSLAGADPEALLGNILFSPARRAVRDVWVGGRQRIAGGRHADQGAIVGRFVDQQRRLWS